MEEQQVEEAGGAGQYSGYKGGNGETGTSYSGGTGRRWRPVVNMEVMVPKMVELVEMDIAQGED